MCQGIHRESMNINLTYACNRDNILPASHAGVVQLVECLLAKEKVVGSSPIARSKPPNEGFFVGLTSSATSPP